MLGWLKAGGRWRIGAGLALAAGLAGGAAFGVAALSGGESAPGGSGASPSVPVASSTASASATATSAAAMATHAGIIDGVPMTDADWDARSNLLPVAVMIDNGPSAMPHSGLDRADLVYEALVEGGITRFMAVYWRQEAGYIEPVRSARTPFVIWVSEIDALYAYAGGAETFNEANAIGQIAEWGIRGLSASGSGADQAFDRDLSRVAPYNLVLDTNKLRDAAAALGHEGPPHVRPWLFKNEGEGTGGLPAAAGIEVNFAADRVAWQLIQWHWDQASNSYLRFQSGGPHADAQTGEQLRFKNIVVMTVPWEVVDESGHVLLGQIGEGPVTVFLDGRMIEGKWRKAERTGRTRFYDETGGEIAFNRGSIFIEVVGPDSLVTVASSVSDLPAIPPYAPPPHYVPEETETSPPEGTPTPPGAASPSPSPWATAQKTPSATKPAGSTTPKTASPLATGSPASTSSPAATTSPAAPAASPSPASTTGSPSATATAK